MRFFVTTTALLLSLASTGWAAQYPTPNNLPAKTAPGQTGFNDCRKRWGDSSPDSLCQNAYVNDINTWCIFAPATVNTVGNAEADTVAYCTKKGFGTRIIPPGTVKGLQFIKVGDEYLQLTAVGDFTKIKLKAHDDGGELDNAGADNVGNPRGGKVFTNAFKGHYERSIHWHMFLGYNEMSMRICSRRGDMRNCPHIYDEQGSQWNDPGVYESGHFEHCQGERSKFPGIYNGKQWFQHDGEAPPAHKPGKTFNCVQQPGIYGLGGHIAQKDVPGS